MTAKREIFKLFPTEVLGFDVSDEITAEDVTAMKADIDHMIQESLHMQYDARTPKYQCRPVLFNTEVTTGQHWQRLARTFAQCCYEYSQSVADICNGQDLLNLSGIRAWFYKSWKTLNDQQSQPWHNHYPGFLSGVFYLDVPTADNGSGGTQFADPRGPLSAVKRDFVVPPRNLSWVIFPSWLNHRPDNSSSEEPRYVIAADCYVRLSG